MAIDEQQGTTTPPAEEQEVTPAAVEEVTPPVPPAEEAPTPPAEEAPAEPVRNLDQERDDRVIPVAQGVLEDLAGQTASLDINDKSEFTNVIVKILNRSLDADLNVVQDNPYVWQLIISVFGAFTQVVMDSKMADSQDARYSSIAHEIMTLLAGAKVPMGMKVTTQDQVAALQSIKPQLEEIFAREMLTRLEVTHILEGLMNAMKVTNQVFENNVNSATNRMEAKILQIDDLSDLTMKKLDSTLKTSIEEILAKQDA